MGVTVYRNLKVPGPVAVRCVPVYSAAFVSSGGTNVSEAHCLAVGWLVCLHLQGALYWRHLLPLLFALNFGIPIGSLCLPVLRTCSGVGSSAVPLDSRVVGCCFLDHFGSSRELSLSLKNLSTTAASCMGVCGSRSLQRFLQA